MMVFGSYLGCSKTLATLDVRVDCIPSTRTWLHTDVTLNNTAHVVKHLTVR